MPVDTVEPVEDDALSWDAFFERADKEFCLDNEKEKCGNVKHEEEHDDAYKNLCDRVATLPHKKAICYGVCTISETPTLVKCEECGLIVNMVGFGHHRKIRHKDHNFITQTIIMQGTPSDDDDSVNSDSEDDCQGFLLSPPHHFFTMASTLDGSPLEYSDEAIGLQQCIDSESQPNTPTKLSPNQMSHPLPTTPHIYGVEKRNDLRLVLKRTPINNVQLQQSPSLTSQSKPQQNLHQRALFQQETTLIKPKQQSRAVTTKKPKKPPLVRVFGQKKKRKGAAAKKKDKDRVESMTVVKQVKQTTENIFTLDDDDEDVVEHVNFNLHEKHQQLQMHSLFKQHTMRNNSFGNSSMNISGNSDTPDHYGNESNNSNDSNVTIPAQLIPCGPGTNITDWDPREAAERPTSLRGGKPVGKVMPIVLNRKTTTTSDIFSTVEQQHSRNHENLGKTAGPSILKRSSMMAGSNASSHGVIGIAERRRMFEKQFQMLQQQQQMQQQPGVGISVLERLFKAPGGITSSTQRVSSNTESSTTTTRRTASMKSPTIASQQPQQKSLMPHHRRRLMPNDYDSTAESTNKRELFSDLSCSIGISDGNNTYLNEQRNANLERKMVPKQAQALDQFHSTAAIEPDTMAAIRSSFMNRAKNRAASNSLGSSFEQQQQYHEFQSEPQQQQQYEYDKSRLLIRNVMPIEQSASSVASPAANTRLNSQQTLRQMLTARMEQQQQGQFECGTRNNASGIDWNRVDSPVQLSPKFQQQQHHDHYYHQKTRKVFSSSSSAISTPNRPQKQQQFITASGTRFVPMDPRGLASLRKNSSTNSFTQLQHSNSSNPSPALTIAATTVPGSGSRSAMSSPSISLTGKNIASNLGEQKVIAVPIKKMGTSAHDDGEEESIPSNMQNQTTDGQNPSATSTSNSCASTPSNISTNSSSTNNKICKSQAQIQQQPEQFDAVMEDTGSGPTIRKRPQQLVQLDDNDKTPQSLIEMQEQQRMTLSDGTGMFSMNKRFRPIIPRSNDYELRQPQMQYGHQDYVQQQQQQPMALNMDALSPAMMQQQQQKPTISHQYYLQQQQRSQPQLGIVPPNATGTTLAPTSVYNAHRQQLLFQKRYPAANTQQLGSVFTIMQQQQQMPPSQQYRPIQQHHHNHPAMMGIRPTQQQIQAAPNGIIRTIAVNASQLSKIGAGNFPRTSHFDYGGSPPPTYHQHQPSSQLYPYGSPPYASGIYPQYQAPPDPAWEFVVGSSPPPTEYFVTGCPGADVVVGSSGMTEPYGQRASSIVHTPAMYNHHYQQQQHNFPAYNQMGVQMHRNVPRPQHQQQTNFSHSQQYNMVNSTATGATIRRLSLNPQSYSQQQQQQMPAFLQPTPQPQNINGVGAGNNFDYGIAGPGYHHPQTSHPKQYPNSHASDVIATNSEKSVDVFGLDPPPVLEAEGALPMQVELPKQQQQLQLHAGSSTNTLLTTKQCFRPAPALITTAKTVSTSTTSTHAAVSTPNAIAATICGDEDEQTNTRSSSASDLDLREVLQTAGAASQIQSQSPAFRSLESKL